MDKNEKDKGFTLTEMLIGLNLAFIALCLTVSLFLFTVKFVGSISKNMSDKEMISASIMKLQDLIRKRRDFAIIPGTGRAVHFIFEKTDTVSLIKDSLHIMNYHALGKLDDYSISLKLYEGDDVFFGKYSMPDIAEYPEGGYSSQMISEINIKIVKDKNTYTFQLAKPPTSENKFRDVEPK